MGFAERVISNASNCLYLLAPRGASAPSAGFDQVRSSDREYEHLLSKVQRLRGAAYVRDGAISASDLDETGRHRSPADLTSWHVLHLGSDGDVQGCARYRAHRDMQSFADLDARHAALAQDHYWGRAMREAVGYELVESSRTQRDFFEVSGWAIAEHARYSESAFTVALATYALGGILGGGRGIATATTRNHSSRILRRLGGTSLNCSGVPLPAYFDPRFGCVMEIISFDTNRPDPKYSSYIQSFVEQIPSIQVFSPARTRFRTASTSQPRTRLRNWRRSIPATAGLQAAR